MKSKTLVVGFDIGFLLKFFLILYFCYILLSRGYFEINRRLKKIRSTSFSLCHWNLNSLTAYNYVKLLSLQACNSVYKHDVVCLSETYLNSSVLSDESHLDFLGYKMVRTEYTGNVKREGACIYFEEPLHLRF